jgi:predicted ArsR family transcriptional regulator
MTTLTDASRRALYDYVRRQDHPVGRDEAAAATAMSRGLAAFHLDKLVTAGLLTARYESPVGRPRGRGRAPKVYEPSGNGLSVTIPERRYELIAEILAAAVAGDDEPVREAAARLAYQRGRELSEHRGADRTDVVAVLADLGFEPSRDDDAVISLRNCPFHPLAARFTDLVCGLNHALVAGLVDGLDVGGTAVLAPRPGRCCVELHTDQPRPQAPYTG